MKRLATEYLYWRGNFPCDNPTGFRDTEIVMVVYSKNDYDTFCHTPQRIWGKLYTPFPIMRTSNPRVFEGLYNLNKPYFTFEMMRISKIQATKHLIQWMPDNPYIEEEIRRAVDVPQITDLRTL